MATLSAAQFKSTCLAVMDEVETTGVPVVITKYGRPVAQLVRMPTPRQRTFMGRLKGRLKLKGDVVTPSFPKDEWDSMRRGGGIERQGTKPRGRKVA